jgi:catechol 2,3-dioxygenase-like lactoylglutathione lyase family enzyme
MADYGISGIQQVGIGVPDLESAWRWYRRNFGFDIPVFEEAAEAPLMTRYTRGEVRHRHAALAMNLAGGGGFEIWQYVGKKTVPPAFQPELGDLGILAVHLKSGDVSATWRTFSERGLLLLGDVLETPTGDPAFHLTDPLGLMFRVVTVEDWFSSQKAPTGGVCGCTIGVSDVDRAKALYGELLGFTETVYDERGVFDDLKVLPGGEKEVRRVLLRARDARDGAFSNLLGTTQLELIQSVHGTGRRIFEGRDWGDLGFIHLCFDVWGMDGLEERCREAGFPFTVDSKNSFDMGEAAGRFSYVEDPDGTLVEFVETHKVPILKKLGWYLDLQKRDPRKPLPNWMIKTMALSRIGD